MTEPTARRRWGLRLSWGAVALTVGGLAAALIAAAGTGAGAWSFMTGFGILRYAFFAAVAGGVLAMIAFFMARRAGLHTGRLNLLALVVAFAFGGYLMNQIATALQVPAIHDATTDLVDVPQFAALEVRTDNLDNIPDDGRRELAALDPESRWKAIHRDAYGDLRALHLPLTVAAATARAEALAKARGWQIARADRQAGTVEATATTTFFRFKDDVVIRIRADPARPGGSIVDMRSISRVGGSDIGVNAERIRSFLAGLEAA